MAQTWRGCPSIIAVLFTVMTHVLVARPGYLMIHGPVRRGFREPEILFSAYLGIYHCTGCNTKIKKHDPAKCGYQPFPQSSTAATVKPNITTERLLFLIFD